MRVIIKIRIKGEFSSWIPLRIIIIIITNNIITNIIINKNITNNNIGNILKLILCN